MIGYKIRNWFYSILGLLVIGVFFSSCLKVEQMPSDEERINLALRQIGDQLYRYCGDDSTKIPPVETISSIEYQLELENGVEYDVLPDIIEKTFLNFNIKGDYIVSILDCKSNDILLGYNTIAVNSDTQACRGREKEDGCNILNVKLYKSDPDLASIPWFYILLGSVGFFGLFIVFFNKRTPKENYTEVEHPQPVQKEVVVNSSVMQIGDLSFDTQLLTLTHNDKVNTLTYREAKLFRYFAENKNEILKREDIQSHVWEEEGIIVGRSLDVFISRLRKIIKTDESLVIKNIHGVGYRLEERIA